MEGQSVENNLPSSSEILPHLMLLCVSKIPLLWGKQLFHPKMISDPFLIKSYKYFLNISFIILSLHSFKLANS